MIPIPNDFDTAKSYEGQGFDTLPVGGHVCRIVQVQTKKSRKGNDMIEVAFDVAEGSKYDGMFRARFNEQKAKTPAAKWPNGGMFRTPLLRNDGKTSGYFKGFITSLEESNPGYSFRATNGDEKIMSGKMIGFCFGEEEYIGNNNKLYVAVKPLFAVSISRAREGVEPPPRKRVGEGGSMESQGFVDVTDQEPLPF